MLRWRAVMPGAVALAALLALAPAPALAGPAVSAWSRTVQLDPDSCADRARKLMTRDGWTNVQKGDGDVVMADKGPLSGMIACISDDLDENEATAVVVVSGGDNGDAEAAADRLRQLLVG